MWERRQASSVAPWLHQQNPLSWKYSAGCGSILVFNGRHTGTKHGGFSDSWFFSSSFHFLLSPFSEVFSGKKALRELLLLFRVAFILFRIECSVCNFIFKRVHWLPNPGFKYRILLLWFTFYGAVNVQGAILYTEVNAHDTQSLTGVFRTPQSLQGSGSLVQACQCVPSMQPLLSGEWGYYQHRECTVPSFYQHGWAGKSCLASAGALSDGAASLLSFPILMNQQEAWTWPQWVLWVSARSVSQVAVSASTGHTWTTGAVSNTARVETTLVTCGSSRINHLPAESLRSSKPALCPIP